MRRFLLRFELFWLHVRHERLFDRCRATGGESSPYFDELVELGDQITKKWIGYNYG
jgi:hypothetical protein